MKENRLILLYKSKNSRKDTKRRLKYKHRIENCKIRKIRRTYSQARLDVMPQLTASQRGV